MPPELSFSRLWPRCSSPYSQRTFADSARAAAIGRRLYALLRTSSRHRVPLRARDEARISARKKSMSAMRLDGDTSELTHHLDLSGADAARDHPPLDESLDAPSACAYTEESLCSQRSYRMDPCEVQESLSRTSGTPRRCSLHRERP